MHYLFDVSAGAKLVLVLHVAADQAALIEDVLNPMNGEAEELRRAFGFKRPGMMGRTGFLRRGGQADPVARFRGDSINPWTTWATWESGVGFRKNASAPQRRASSSISAEP